MALELVREHAALAQGDESRSFACEAACAIQMITKIDFACHDRRKQTTLVTRTEVIKMERTKAIGNSQKYDPRK